MADSIVCEFSIVRHRLAPLQSINARNQQIDPLAKEHHRR